MAWWHDPLRMLSKSEIQRDIPNVSTCPFRPIVFLIMCLFLLPCKSRIMSSCIFLPSHCPCVACFLISSSSNFQYVVYFALLPQISCNTLAFTTSFASLSFTSHCDDCPLLVSLRYSIRHILDHLPFSFSDISIMYFLALFLISTIILYFVFLLRVSKYN